MESVQTKGLSRRQTALSGLLDLCESDPRLAPILQKYGATRATLEELYTMLLSSGAGQWVRGHFVAASALVFPATLDYLLRMRRDDLKDADSVQEVAFRLLQYFGGGEVGPIG